METILFMGLVVGVLWLSVYLSGKHQKRGQALHKAYRAAIANGDRAQALRNGRAFYNYCRNGKLTLNDELAIKKEMSEMK